MDQNTVILSIDKYDELMKHKEYREKRTVLIQSGVLNNYTCETDDEAVMKLSNDLRKCKMTISELENKLRRFNNMTVRDFKLYKRGE